MPNRLIHESCRQSETLAKLSDRAERVFWRLTTAADDYGRFNANPAVIRGLCFAAMLDKISDKQIQASLKELQEVGLVELYVVGGRRLGCFVTWSQYQQQRAKKPKFASPEECEHMQTGDFICNHLISNAERPDRARLSNLESRISTPESRIPDTDKRRKRPLPEDFQLTSERSAIAAEYGLDAERTFVAFRSYWLGSMEPKANWDQVWLNWCVREKKPAPNVPRAGPIQQTLSPGMANLKRAHDAAVARANGAARSNQDSGDGQGQLVPPAERRPDDRGLG